MVAYAGGKAKISRHIVRELVERHGPRIGSYVEPFLGGANVAEAVAPHCVSMRLADLRPDLVMMFRAHLDGSWTPPETCSRSRYLALRTAPPSPDRGFYGSAMSFGGKWFGGYSGAWGNRQCDDYLGMGQRACERVRSALSQADSVEWFPGVDYRAVPIRPGDVVYCDPPYAGTTDYGAYLDGTRWDAAAFWRWAQAVSAFAFVYVSESAAPAGWRPVWSGTQRVKMDKANNRELQPERLYTLGPELPKALVREQESHA